MSLRAALPFLVASCLGGCDGCQPMVTHPDANDFPDVHDVPPPAPILEPLPAVAPYPIITVRGRAFDADTVVVEVAGRPSPQAVSVLPGGLFCMDIEVPTEAEYMLEARSIGPTGLESLEAAFAMTRYDLTAAPIPGAERCDGSDPGDCISPPPEDCDLPGDQDCDFLQDPSDPDCSDCLDDVLEPNNSVATPTVSPARYDGMVLCSGNDDYYPVMVRAGQQLSARIFFIHSAGNLDLSVIGPDGTTVLGMGASTDDDEAVTITASADGRHYAHVYGVDAAQNSYAITLGVM